MLVVTRNVNEKVIIDDNITITVTRIKDGRVRLGFEAPPGVKILREEIYNQIRNSQGQLDGSNTG